MTFFRAAAAAVLVLACMALPLAAQPRVGLDSRMSDLQRAVDSGQRDSVAAFFPRRGSWSWRQTVRSRRGDAVVAVGTWRFSAADARRAIGERGPLCESFEPMSGGAGPFEGRLGMQLSVGLPDRRWRRVGRNRFVPPDEPDHSRIFVQWRREEGRWLISSFGDETLARPVAEGRVVRTDEVQRTAPVAPPAYAADAEWYRQNTPVVLDGYRYIKYGRPRPLAPDQIERIGTKDGVPVYAARGDGRAPAVIYVAIDASNFQPYEAPHGRSSGPCR
ncbi:MAG: hypothetical protein AVDCRST_MAG68-3172 [uncultured Gemmatimonadetes bacterium]|uniref:DUF4440 domain-containing protein n=1 Tax=uncultured Gemmatimonadota bacterium TaxID=203437 RepID=A0A6J4LXB4_9BACT|nr:MAG: hypothetical protein AVDCRST_MAG68-3172 [uncultured Gemmatimonadota bacterium]